MKFVSYLVLSLSFLSFALSNFALAENVDCFDHENTPEENFVCKEFTEKQAQAFDDALIAACGDDSSTPLEVETCKQEIRTFCIENYSGADNSITCAVNAE